MKAACWSMAVLAGVLTGASLLNDLLFGGKFYTSPVLLLPALFFAGCLLWCMAREKPSMRKLGFYLCHGGVLLVLIGVLMGWGFGQNVNFHIPVDPTAAYGEVQTSSGGLISFGFDISVQSFELERTGTAVSQYRAELRLIGDGTDEVRTMKVNAPVDFEGWRFYLMDYDRDGESYVFLHAKKDPGNRIFAAGLWCVILGTAAMCLRIAPGGVRSRQAGKTCQVHKVHGAQTTARDCAGERRDGKR